MNKKIISVFAAVTVAASSAAAVFAEENTVKVVVNGSNVEFVDQQPIIENDRTLIPVRGAFGAMGGSVDWDEKTRTVTVRSKTNTRQAVLTIDSDIMVTYTYKSLLDVEKKEVKLDVPAKIINDRTMLPLRAIGEALGAVVGWDEKTYTASITTEENIKSTTEDNTKENVKDATEDNTKENVKDNTEDSTKKTTEDKKVDILSLSLSQAESEKDDEVVVSVDISNLANYPDMSVAGVKVGLNYDPEAIEFVSASLYNGDTKVGSGIGADNAKFKENRLKSSYITNDRENAAKSDGSVMKLVFKKLKDNPGSVSLSNSYHSKLGYDTNIVLISLDGATTKDYSGSNIYLDTDPLELK